MKNSNKKCVIFIFLFIGLSLGISQEQTVGLFINDSSSYNGYTLFTPKSSKNTYLINNDGLLINKWESDYIPTMTVYMLENGNLLRSSKITDGGAQGGGFQELLWNGEVAWEYCNVLQHHDIEPLPNGNVLLILNETKTGEEAIEAGFNPEVVGSKLRVLHIIEVENSGLSGSNIVWEWHVWDHLVQDIDSTKANYGNVSEHRELLDANFMYDGSIDWLHPNSVEYNSELDQILISYRHINEIWIIDHSTTTEEAASHAGGNSGKGGDILFRWGNPASYKMGTIEDQKLFGQHNANWIEPGINGEGNIILFNNGLNRPDSSYSSVDEIIPPVDDNGFYSYEPDSAFGPLNFKWSYILEDEYFSSKFSSAQRLPNGNTLICSGNHGVFIEITPEYEIVWKYVNPVDDDGPVMQGDTILINNVGQCYKYSPDFPGFSGLDLTPGEPIEIYPAESVVGNQINEKKFRLYNNFPNPFNPKTTISYDVSMATKIHLDIFNIRGDRIITLVNQNKQPGNYSVDWNGKNSNGDPVPSGVYFFKLFSEGNAFTKKMLLLK